MGCDGSAGGLDSRYGIPAALYVDRKSVYVTDREPTVEEQLAGLPAMTQFGRACHKLGIRIVEAHSPQAKGRVERKHGVCQDRLIKEMKLDEVSDIASGNLFLEKWLPKLNRRFAVAPRSDVDLHRALPDGLDLRTIFCLEEQRTVGNDWTVQYGNRFYQITKQKGLPRAKSKVWVQEWRDGSIHILHKGNALSYHELDARPEKPAKPKQVLKARIPQIPAADHPWKSYAPPGKGNGMPLDRRGMFQTLEELADTYLGPVRVGAI